MNTQTKRDLIEAQKFLRSLKVGEPVTVMRDGKPMLMTVQGGLQLQDYAYEGGSLVGAGSWESAGVRVGYGVGRYNTRVSVTAQAMRGVGTSLEYIESEEE